MSTSLQLSLHGIKCCSCLARVEEVLQKQQGVQSLKIDADARTASIEGDIPVDTIIAAIRDAGYDASVL